MKAVLVALLILCAPTVSEARRFGGFFGRPRFLRMMFRPRFLRRQPVRVVRRMPVRPPCQRGCFPPPQGGHAGGQIREQGQPGIARPFDNQVQQGDGTVVNPGVVGVAVDEAAVRPSTASSQLVQPTVLAPVIANDGTYPNFMRKVQKLQCESGFDNTVWRTLNDPADPRFNITRAATLRGLPAAHQILNDLETLRKEGALPLDVNFTVMEQNVINERKSIALSVDDGKVHNVNIYADNPPSLATMRSFFASLPADKRAAKLSDEAQKVRAQECQVFFKTGIYGGIAQDGNISLEQRAKILRVIETMADKGLVPRNQFLYFSNTVQNGAKSDARFEGTILINPDATESQLTPFFLRKR